MIIILKINEDEPNEEIKKYKKELEDKINYYKDLNLKNENYTKLCEEQLELITNTYKSLKKAFISCSISTNLALFIIIFSITSKITTKNIAIIITTFVCILDIIKANKMHKKLNTVINNLEKTIDEK